MRRPKVAVRRNKRTFTIDVLESRRQAEDGTLSKKDREFIDRLFGAPSVLPEPCTENPLRPGNEESTAGPVEKGGPAGTSE